MKILALIFVAILSVGATTSAQISRRVAVGASVGVIDPSHENLDRAIVVGPVFAVRRGQGWGPAIGFSWYRTQDKDDLVEYRVRPVMVGVAYSAQKGRVRASPSFVAGYSFNRAKIKGSGQRVDFEDAVAWRPGLSLWFDTDSRASLNTFVGYLVTRGDLDFGTGPRGSPPGKLKADAFIWTAGVAVWVW